MAGWYDLLISQVSQSPYTGRTQLKLLGQSRRRKLQMSGVTIPLHGANSTQACERLGISKNEYNGLRSQSPYTGRTQLKEAMSEIAHSNLNGKSQSPYTGRTQLKDNTGYARVDRKIRRAVTIPLHGAASSDEDVFGTQMRSPGRSALPLP